MKEILSPIRDGKPEVDTRERKAVMDFSDSLALVGHGDASHDDVGLALLHAQQRSVKVIEGVERLR